MITPNKLNIPIGLINVQNHGNMSFIAHKATHPIVLILAKIQPKESFPLSSSLTIALEAMLLQVFTFEYDEAFWLHHPFKQC